MFQVLAVLLCTWLLIPTQSSFASDVHRPFPASASIGVLWKDGPLSPQQRTASQQCQQVSNLQFCSSVNYSTSVVNPRDLDSKVEQLFRQVSPQKLQTKDCLEAYKGYLCSFYFPRCPYCPNVNGICRTGCIDLTARCAISVQDSIAFCYGGSLFVNDNSTNATCTPYYLPSSLSLSSQSPHFDNHKSVGNATVGYSCIRPDPIYASFCQPEYAVVSAPHNYTQVWTRMDNATFVRYKSFASATSSQECKDFLKDFFCALYFSPCDDEDHVYDPLPKVFGPLCQKMPDVCPMPFVKKLCSFVPYDPPNPALCNSSSN